MQPSSCTFWLVALSVNSNPCAHIYSGSRAFTLHISIHGKPPRNNWMDRCCKSCSDWPQKQSLIPHSRAKPSRQTLLVVKQASATPNQRHQRMVLWPALCAHQHMKADDLMSSSPAQAVPSAIPGVSVWDWWVNVIRSNCMGLMSSSPTGTDVCNWSQRWASLHLCWK